MSKSEIRQKILRLRKTHSKKEYLENNSSIEEKLAKLNEFKKAHVILIYLSLPDEVETYTIINNFKEKIFVAPRIADFTKEPLLQLFEFTHPKHTLKNKFGILEPRDTNRWFLPEEIDLAIIPGVAFDLKCNRLGFGKGYYDKLLKKLHCPSIGLAYELQIVPKLPLDEHDEAVDMIVTEERVIRKQK